MTATRAVSRSFVLLACAFISLPDSASASTMFTGSFGRYVAEGAQPVVSIGDSSITWGDPGGFGVGPSSIAYHPYEISTATVLSGQPFALGMLEYFNGTITTGSGISHASLFFSPLSDDDQIDEEGNFEEQFDTVSTPNIGDARENSDFVVFSTFIDDDLSNYFNVPEGGTGTADIMARLDFLPLGTDPLMASPLTAHLQLTLLGFGNAQGDGFLTDAALPEPSGFALLGLGLLGLSSYRWRVSPQKRRRGRR